MTDRHLQFRFDTYARGGYRVFWDMETNEGSISDGFIIEPTTAEEMLNNSFSSVISVTGEAFVGALYPYEFTENFLRAFGDFQPIREVYETMLEDDNPILIYYYID
jgi:hypothetical protein